MDRVRLDKWLWAARFTKTRTAATELVLAGHVKVGGERVKPAREIATGETLEIVRGTVRHVVLVTGLADRLRVGQGRGDALRGDNRVA